MSTESCVLSSCQSNLEDSLIICFQIDRKPIHFSVCVYLKRHVVAEAEASDISWGILMLRIRSIFTDMDHITRSLTIVDEHWFTFRSFQDVTVHHPKWKIQSWVDGDLEQKAVVQSLQKLQQNHVIFPHSVTGKQVWQVVLSNSVDCMTGCHVSG